MSRHVYDPDEVALVGGRWEPNGRGTLRWVTANPRPALEPVKAFVDLIACPACRAKVTDSCRTDSGGPRSPHVNRLVSRRCPCGSLLEPFKRLCLTCREANDRESKLDHGRRRYAELMKEAS